MIIDTLDNFGKYVGLHPLFVEVAEFLKKNNLNDMKDGRYAIKGDDLFLNLYRYQLMVLRLMAIHHCRIFL